MNKYLKIAAIAIGLGFGSLSAQADPIPVTIDFTPSSGPGLSGSFTWEDSNGAVSDLIVNLGAFGPFAGGPNDGSPLSFGAGTYVNGNFTTDIELLYAPYFRIFLRANGGGYQGSNGRVGGSYATTAAAVSVPEPGTLALLGIGLFGLGLARRKAA